MKELTIIEKDGLLLTDSRIIAEQIGKRHSDLLRSIDSYVEILENAELRSQNFFIKDTYKVEGNNKDYSCYLLTKQGCEMVANKMTGEKGVLFTAKYVNAFNKMEKAISTIGNKKELLDIINKQTSLIERLENIIASKPIEVKEKSNLISEEEIKEIFNVVIDKYGFIEHPTKYVVNKYKVYEEIEKRGISKRAFNNSLIKTKLVEISSNGKYKRPMICISTPKGRTWSYVLRKNKLKII